MVSYLLDANNDKKLTGDLKYTVTATREQALKIARKYFQVIKLSELVSNQCSKNKKAVPLTPLQSVQNLLFLVCCDTITNVLSTFL